MNGGWSGGEGANGVSSEERGEIKVFGGGIP